MIEYVFDFIFGNYSEVRPFHCQRSDVRQKKAV